jgi:hypothetical protein
MTSIRTIEGDATSSSDDLEYMEYLDEIGELPNGHSFGLLLFKADPIAFRMGRDEWLIEHRR